MREEVTYKVAGKLAFIGTGKMAEVWIERLVHAGAIAVGDWMACDIDPEKLSRIREKFGNQFTTTNPREAARFAHLIVVATPPAEVVRVLGNMRPELSPGHVVVSLAAGVPLAKLESLLGDVPVIRVMPNTPALVGEAMNLVVFGRTVSPASRAEIESLLEVFGKWQVVDDPLMDYWCALTAVGPAYIFPIVEGLSSAATAKGLPLEQAMDAVAQVLAGVGRMVQSSGRGISELKQMIGLHTLREGEAKALFADAYNDAVTKLEGVTRRVAAA